MRLALAVFAYLFGVGAVIAAAVAGYQVMLPVERSAVATASSVPPPRSEPKRVEPIRPINEPYQTPTPKFEASGVPLSATAAYNKKKAKEQYEKRRSVQRKHRAPAISEEAANSFGWTGQNYAPPPQQRWGGWPNY